MKQMIFLGVLLLFALTKTTAQEQKSTKNVFLQSGIINNGYNATVGFETLFGTKKENGFNVSFNFHRVNHSPNAVPIIYEEKSTYASFSYKKYLLKNNGSHFTPYIGLGFIGGYQYLSEASDGFYRKLPENNFLYGGISYVGVEYSICRFSVFAEGAYLFTGYHYVRGNMGIKYHF